MTDEGDNPSTNPMQSSPARRLPRTCGGTSNGEFATLPAILRTSLILSAIDPILLSFPTRGMSSISASRVSKRPPRRTQPKSGRRRTTINLIKYERFFGLVASPDSSPPRLTVSVDVLAGEDDPVQFDEGLRIDARTGVTPIDCEVSAWLAWKPTGDLASGDRHIVFR